MKLLAHVEGLAVGATIVTANLPQDTLMAVTANKTADKAGANALVIGRLVVAAKTANASGTIETRFKSRVEIKTAAVIAAGDVVKLASADSTTGENRVDVWVDGTDSVKRQYGVAWKGAASGGTAEILTF
jgi:hypothetical protein